MKRAIVSPAILPASALTELKQWLAISTAHDDAPLSALLRASLDMCEAYTGSMPLVTGCEEVLTAQSGWICLSTMPVQSISSVLSVEQDGSRNPFAADAYELDLNADGGGRVRLLKHGNATRIAVGFSAGLASDWDALPEPLRHGIIRLAAHQHRERETDSSASRPPAAVAALWQPWRRMRVA